MIKKISPEQLNYLDNYVVVDVRSPAEYNDSTIPGAINIPIFTDSEREEIGVCYKQCSINEAKRIGIGYAANKLLSFYDFVNSKTPAKVIFFCSRGGLRSTVIASTLSSLGLNIMQLEGGYKAYRRYVLDNLLLFKEKFKVVVLHGNTGVGKTEILQRLERLDLPVVDLEGLANNRGSFFGAVGLGKPISQKMFESLLLNKLQSLSSDYIIVESESKRIGNIFIPDFLVDQMKKGVHILITTNTQNRIKRLVRDYVSVNNTEAINQELIYCINKTRKVLGNEKVNKMIEWINEKNYDSVAELLLKDYYDPLYSHSQNKYGYFDNIIDYDNIEQAVINITSIIKKLNFNCSTEGENNFVL